MRVKGVVVLEPQGQLGDDGFCVRDGVHRDVVAFERFDEGFGPCRSMRVTACFWPAGQAGLYGCRFRWAHDRLLGSCLAPRRLIVISVIAVR